MLAALIVWSTEVLKAWHARAIEREKGRTVKRKERKERQDRKKGKRK